MEFGLYRIQIVIGGKARALCCNNINIYSFREVFASPPSAALFARATGLRGPFFVGRESIC